MIDKEKSKKDIIETSLAVAPFAVQLLDPEITINPLSVVTKVLAGIAGHFLAKFASEYKEKRENGIFKNEPFTEKPPLISANLLKMISEGKVDEERFRAMKSIFFRSLEKDATEEQEQLAYQLFETAKQLSGAEVLILSANYAVVSNTGKPIASGVFLSSVSIDYWAGIISEKIGGNFLKQIVFQYEKHLIDLQLISGHHYAMDTNRVASNFESTRYFRMTDLGYILCEFITKYE